MMSSGWKSAWRGGSAVPPRFFSAIATLILLASAAPARQIGFVGGGGILGPR